MKIYVILVGAEHWPSGVWSSLELAEAHEKQIKLGRPRLGVEIVELELDKR